jgi:diacylglycerol kinase
MYKRMRGHSTALANALNGLFWVFRTQPNFQFHMLVGFIVICLAFALGLSGVEVAVLSITIVFVLVCEIMNTILEILIDLYSSEWKGQIKVAKDVSAGMVLVAALGSVIVGSSIFVPHFVRIINSYFF